VDRTGGSLEVDGRVLAGTEATPEPITETVIDVLQLLQAAD
jgi:hypothetical protein